MQLERRFISRGNAVALAGFIEEVLERPVNGAVSIVNASSSLPVSGGASESTSGPYAYPSAEVAAVSVQACHTRVWHETRRGVQVTQTRSEVKQLRIGTGPTLAVDSFAVEMRSEHGEDAAVPAIALNAPPPLDLRLDGSTLRVTFHADLAGKFRTFPELKRAYEEDDGFFKARGHCFADRERPGARRQLTPHKGYVLMCLVDRMQWVGEPHQDFGRGLTIDGHVITWNGFGRIYVGELLVSELARRFTLLRTKLGSPVRGELSAGEVETNGVTFP